MKKVENPSKLLRAMARMCANCPVCRSARKNPGGFFYRSVKTIESKICPFCIAYEKVTGRKAFEAP